MLKTETIRTIQTIFILVAAVVAWIFIPEETLMPVAWATLAVCVGVVFAIKAYMNKLSSESRLFGPDQLFYTEVAMAFALVGLAAFIILLGVYA